MNHIEQPDWDAIEDGIEAFNAERERHRRAMRTIRIQGFIMGWAIVIIFAAAVFLG